MIASPVVALVICLIFLGLVFYCIELIPLAPPFPVVIRVIAIVLALLVLFQFIGLIGTPIFMK